MESSRQVGKLSFTKYLLCAPNMPEAWLCTGRCIDAFPGALVSGGSWVDSTSRQPLGVIVRQDSGLGGMGHQVGIQIKETIQGHTHWSSGSEQGLFPE